MNVASMNTSSTVSSTIAHTKPATKHPQTWQRPTLQGRLCPQMHTTINGSEMDVEGNGTDVGENSEATSKMKAQREQCLVWFQSWNQTQQTEFVEHLIARMSFHQHEHLYAILLPMLQRDFITALPAKGLQHIAYKILSYLDAYSLCQAEQVCVEWYKVIEEGMLWKRLIEKKVQTDPVWKGLSERRGWGECLFRHIPTSQSPSISYRELYPSIKRDIKVMEENWRKGAYTLTRIECHSENSKGVYCLQYDEQKIVSGLRDNTIKIWNRKTQQCERILQGHTGSVLCLQYDERVIITGSSDSTIRVWDIHTGAMLSTLVHHCEAVLHLRFNAVTMVTCSKDRTIAVWDMKSPSDIVLRRVLVGHRAAVNVVDFDDRYIVSASGDRTIKIWRTSTSEFVRTLHGHRRGIACLQYRGHLVVSGSSDNTIRIWDIECGSCLRLLEGHDELVRCIRFDNKRIVSGAYDGTIKIWDLQAALNQRSPPDSLCLNTLSQHTGRVFRLQFDDFQIVSSSHDDTILVWDFLNPESPTATSMDTVPPQPQAPLRSPTSPHGWDSST